MKKTIKKKLAKMRATATKKLATKKVAPKNTEMKTLTQVSVCRFAATPSRDCRLANSRSEF